MRPFSCVNARVVGGLVMPVVECDVPPASALSRHLAGNAYFHDSYRAPLLRPDLAIVDLFFALFGHTPLYGGALSWE